MLRDYMNIALPGFSTRFSSELHLVCETLLEILIDSRNNHQFTLAPKGRVEPYVS